MRYFLGLLCFIALPALAQPAPLYEISGTTTLRWVPPTQNVDGSPLTDLAGYRLYWGRESGLGGPPYENTLEISDGASTNRSFSFPIDDEGDTTWFFAMTAFDTDGNESAFSNEIRRVVTVTITDNRPPAPPVLQEVEMDLTCIGSSADIICTIQISDG